VATGWVATRQYKALQMSPKVIQFRLGIGACLIALLLAFVGIPNWVSSPSNVRNIVLAPTFWPYVLTSFTGIIGLALIASAPRAAEPSDPQNNDLADSQTTLRLIALALIMVAIMFALPRLGMVWTAMLAFVITAFLFKTRHPKTALVCAVVIPLALYLFFAHVAGVAIPQGNYVRLP
jgi:putative tricarboxylic transport membrane protein